MNGADVVVSSANLATTQKNGGRMCPGDVDNDGQPDVYITNFVMQ